MRDFQNLEDELLRNDWRAWWERTNGALRAQREEASERAAGIVEAQNAAEALGIEYRQLQREMREMERAAAIMGEELLVGNPRRVMAGLVARAATPTQLFYRESTGCNGLAGGRTGTAGRIVSRRA